MSTVEQNFKNFPVGAEVLCVYEGRDRKTKIVDIIEHGEDYIYAGARVAGGDRRRFDPETLRSLRRDQGNHWHLELIPDEHKASRMSRLENTKQEILSHLSEVSVLDEEEIWNNLLRLKEVFKDLRQLKTLKESD